MPKNELLCAWLRDAHSMEKALADFTDKAVKNFEDDVQIQTKLRELRDQSLQSQTKIAESLERLGESASGGKDLLGKVVGFFSGVGSSLYQDDIVKDILVMHAAFHFAHASYLSLTYAAKQLGEAELSELCDRLAHERESVATWAANLVPDVTARAIKPADK